MLSCNSLFSAPHLLTFFSSSFLLFLLLHPFTTAISYSICSGYAMVCMSIQFGLSSLPTVCTLFLLFTRLPGRLECAELDHKLANITRTDTLLNLSEQVGDRLSRDSDWEWKVFFEFEIWIIKFWSSGASNHRKFWISNYLKIISKHQKFRNFCMSCVIVWTSTDLCWPISLTSKRNDCVAIQ